MPGSTTNRLLALLGGAVLVAAAAVALDLGMERLSAAKGRIALHEGQLRALQRSLPSAIDQLVQQRDTLRADVQQRAARFYAKDETDPYAFGAVIRNELASLGIAVLRYQVIDVKGASYLEFSVSGSARSFVQFLRAVSQAPRAWTIPSMTLSVEEGSGVVNVDFRIGYAIGDALPDPSAAAAAPAGSVFEGGRPAAQPAAPEAILTLLVGRQAPKAAAPAPATVPPQQAPWMKYLGRAFAADGSTQVYLKDTKTGRLMTATRDAGAGRWVLVQEQDDAVIVKNGDTAYSVGKR